MSDGAAPCMHMLGHRGSQGVTGGHRGSQRVTGGHSLCTQWMLTGAVCVTPLRAVPASVHGPSPRSDSCTFPCSGWAPTLPLSHSQVFPAQLSLCPAGTGRQGTVPAATLQPGMLCGQSEEARLPWAGAFPWQQEAEDEDDAFPQLWNHWLQRLQKAGSFPAPRRAFGCLRQTES